MASTDWKISSPGAPGLKPPLSTSVYTASASSPSVYVSVLPDHAPSQLSECIPELASAPGGPSYRSSASPEMALPLAGVFSCLSPTLQPPLPSRRCPSGSLFLTHMGSEKALVNPVVVCPAFCQANPISKILLGKLLVQRPPPGRSQKPESPVVASVLTEYLESAPLHTQ